MSQHMSLPHVLCIAGSPRRRGNSDALLDAFIAGVSDAGGLPIRLVASEARVAPCRGCNSCSKTGFCVIRDGMDDVYALIDSAQAVCVATPVYFATVPAVLKTLFDRCQPYWARRHVLGHDAPASKRPGMTLVVGGGGDPFGAGCAITAVKSVYGVLGVESLEVLEVTGPDKPGDIAHRPEDLARATELGRLIVARIGDGTR